MQNRSRTEYSILNIATGVGGYVLNTILGFVCRMVFVRCLAVDYLGINGLFTNILAMLSLAELGIGNAIVFALYKPLAEKDEGKTASLMKIYSVAYCITGTFVFAAGLALMPFLDVIIREQPDIRESIYLLYAINLFNTASTYFFSYRSSLLAAAQRNYIVNGISYAVTAVQSLVQMAFLLLFRNYLGYLLVQTAGIFIYNITVFCIAGKSFPFIKEKNPKPLLKEEKRVLFSNIRDLMIYKVSGLLVNSTDNILITFFSGLGTAGIASNYTLLVNTLNSLLGQVFGGLTASVGNHNASESDEKRFELFGTLNLANFWIFSWGTVGIIFCSTDMVRLFFGEEYVLSFEIPLVIALNFFSVGMMNAIWTYKHTLGLFHHGRFVQIFTGILNIVFSVVLGKCWGLFGILAATFFARAVTNLWYDPYALFVYGFKKPPVSYLKKTIKYAAVLLAETVLCGICFCFMKEFNIAVVLMKAVICSIIANGVFILAYSKTPEFIRLKKYVFGIWDRLFCKNG